jgi:NADH-quinone oxidoreductase subunit C
MDVLSAEQLREHLNRDLPGVIAPSRQPATNGGEAEKPKAKGKGKAKPDFLVTSDTVIVTERLPDVVRYMCNTLGYEYLSDVAVVDYLDDGLFELVYRFYNLSGGDSLVLKVRVPRDEPDVPSITPILPGANFHEREGFDLFGINFTGHPNLKRLYMWDEFEGYPMRKDFPKQGDKYLSE